MGEKQRRRIVSLTWPLGLLLLAAAAGQIPSLVSGSGSAAGVGAGWPEKLRQVFGLGPESLPDGAPAIGGTGDTEGTVAATTEDRPALSGVVGAAAAVFREPVPAGGSATRNDLHGPSSREQTEAPDQLAVPVPTRDASAEGERSITASRGGPGPHITTQGDAKSGAAPTSPARIPADILPLNLNQALLGPLAGATIHAYRLGDLRTPVEGPILADGSRADLARAGTFQLTLAGIPKNEWILVTATGGRDLDAEDDGVLDAAPTFNDGTIHALAKAADWRLGGVKVSALSDIFWRYTRNLADKVRPDEISIRLGDLLGQFIQTDLTGDRVITLRDLLVFSPANPAHRAALNFDYARLFALDAEGHSIVAALHAGDEATLERLLDREFGHTLSRVPAPDSRYQYGRIALGATGEGRAVAAGGVLVVDSALPAEEQVRVAYFPRDAAQTLVFTAAPTADSRILSWTGCDLVSNDRTQCTIGLGGSRDVWVSFGWLDTTPPGISRQDSGGAAAASIPRRPFPVHDLSAATNTLYPDLIDVVVSPRDPVMIPLLASIKPYDYIVGSTGDGFLRRVTAVHRVDDTHYRLETIEANLDEVVGVGSGGLSRALTNADLRGYQAPTATKPARVSPDAFQGLPGIRLVPSADPMDPVFRLQFGTQPHQPCPPIRSGAPCPCRSSVSPYTKAPKAR